jgi:toxin ParE1/3/4
MTRVVVLARVNHDLERIVEHLLSHDIPGPEARIEDIIAALDVLATNPLIGRPAACGLRELIIGRDNRGYLALYAYDPRVDEAAVVAIRSQKESGYQYP